MFKSYMSFLYFFQPIGICDFKSYTSYFILPIDFNENV